MRVSHRGTRTLYLCATHVSPYCAGDYSIDAQLFVYHLGSGTNMLLTRLSVPKTGRIPNPRLTVGIPRGVPGADFMPPDTNRGSQQRAGPFSIYTRTFFLTLGFNAIRSRPWPFCDWNPVISEGGKCPCRPLRSYVVTPRTCPPGNTRPLIFLAVRLLLVLPESCYSFHSYDEHCVI